MVSTAWLKLPATQIGSRLAAEALGVGFVFHQADHAYLMLCKWLKEDGPSRLPSAPIAYIGAGAMVLNERGEILLCQEKHPYAGIFAWKLPGGLVNPGESIIDAAAREVFEETAIQVDVSSAEIANMRLNTSYIFKKTDLYFVVIMKAQSSEISIDRNELTAARWTSLADFLATDDPDRVTKHNIALIQNSLTAKERGATWTAKSIPQRNSMTFYSVDS